MEGSLLALTISYCRSSKPYNFSHFNTYENGVIDSVSLWLVKVAAVTQKASFVHIVILLHDDRLTEIPWLLSQNSLRTNHNDYLRKHRKSWLLSKNLSLIFFCKIVPVSKFVEQLSIAQKKVLETEIAVWAWLCHQCSQGHRGQRYGQTQTSSTARKVTWIWTLCFRNIVFCFTLHCILHIFI